jgi:predicted alpha/beta superfamily hydrolase
MANSPANPVPDATEFLQFIRDELIPFIDALYPVLPNDNSYSGYSAGGGFGLYTLFTRPDTFRRYILGSPTSSVRGFEFGVELARTFIQSGRVMSAKVFLSVGELEEFERGLDHFGFVTGYYRLSAEGNTRRDSKNDSRCSVNPIRDTFWPR